MRLAFCCACGTDDRSVLEHHHLVPRSEGGTDDETNLITLCSPCHGKAHGIVRKDLSKLTKAGLARAKARGVKLGVTGKDRAQENKARSTAFAAGILDTVRELQVTGTITTRALASALNEKGVTTMRGGKWYQTSVVHLLRTIKAL